MSDFKVLVTDFAWDTLDIEARVLEPIGAELIVSETGDEAELLRLAPFAHAILTNWKRVSPAVLDAAPLCRTVARYGVGVDNIAVDHATALGILVSNVPDYCVDEVAEHAMALLLACARSLPTFDRDIRAGKWDLAAGRPLFRVRGKTLVVVGAGNIGRVMIERARAFGLQVIAVQRQLEGEIDGVVYTRDLHAALGRADFVSLHVPLNEGTKGLVDEHFLRAMRPGAFLINTARGAVVNERVLAHALREGWIRGAALDVLSSEPPPADHPLLGLPNCLITPHAAFNSVEAVEDLQARAAGHVRDVLTGKIPPHVVNPAVLDSPHRR
ncbi:MAG: C-terminal binding protein [Pleurocapsa minor GSE-CHR-MK-17-07R]|jgi:D-3-phosphoglycerate dehydrogenase|nr:C-terminal binding protein [Pleurocapsa minor GSE-CHR-MK 17-07R]